MYMILQVRNETDLYDDMRSEDVFLQDEVVLKTVHTPYVDSNTKFELKEDAITCINDARSKGYLNEMLLTIIETY